MFGSLCFASTLKGHRKKLDSRSKKYVYLGYKPGTKDDIMFDLQSKELFVSRDVSFFKHHLPYKHPPVNSTNPSLATQVSNDTYLDGLLDYSYKSNSHPTPASISLYSIFFLLSTCVKLET